MQRTVVLTTLQSCRDIRISVHDTRFLQVSNVWLHCPRTSTIMALVVTKPISESSSTNESLALLVGLTGFTYGGVIGKPFMGVSSIFPAVKSGCDPVQFHHSRWLEVVMSLNVTAFPHSQSC